MEEKKETIKNIPNGAILLKNKIFIPYDNKEGEIPLNSILYNNSIYIEYKLIDPNKNQKNSDDKIGNKSESAINKNKEKLNKKDSKENNEIGKHKKNKKLDSENKNEDKIILEDSEEENLFKKLNKYYYNTENNKVMKYSLNRINKSIKTNKYNSVSFNCYDTYYGGRAH